MSQNVGFALIGCGAAGKIHARAIAESQSAELCCVMDIDPRPAESLGERFGVSSTCQLERVLDDSAIDAVSIAVPHHLHFEIAERAARAGKHILLEKPFTLNVTDALRLTTLCRECDVVCAPWLERRFLPYIQQVHELLARQVIGDVVYTRICTLGYKPRAYWQHGMRFEEYTSTWREKLATSGGGILIMNAIHQIDLMAYLTGLKIAEVFAHTATLHHEVEVEDLALVNLKYESCALGVIEASCCTYGAGQFPIERPADAIMGTDGYIQLGSPLKCFDRIRFAQEYSLPQLSVTDQKIRQLDNFTAHLQTGAPLRCTAEDAIQALSVIEAAYLSASTRTPITID